MKKVKIVLVCLLLIATVSGLLSWKSFDSRSIERSYTNSLNIPVTMCGSFAMDWSDTTFVQTKLLSGLGSLTYPVTTASKEAQEFFNQGLRLIYAFNHWEAIQSFRHAIKLDRDFAMAYWGLALAYGPNLNDVNPKDRERLAFEAIQKAVARSKRVSASERDFINALASRYNGKAYDDRDSLNQAYAASMKILAQKYPDDHEVLTLYADALMNTMAWDYYLPDGKQKPGTIEAKAILEKVTRRFPDHAGAHHLYIHLLEASSNPDEALKSANFLEDAMPGAGHIVHMPAHIYIRVGQYGKSIEVNQKAVKVDENYLANSDNRGMYRWSYYPHNIDFITYSAYMEGRSELAIQSAMKLAYKGNLMSTSNPVMAQHFGIEPMIAFTRFGKWNDILALQEPDKDLIYAQVLYRFSKGLALIRTDKTNLAETELFKLDSLSRLDTLQSLYAALNPVAKLSLVAVNILRGEVLMAQNRQEAALKAFAQAVATEDSFRYNEPWDWKIPARHFLGAALLQAEKYSEAEKVFTEDLKRNRENGWALYGLLQSQKMQGKKADVSVTEKQFNRAWSRSDVELHSSRF